MIAAMSKTNSADGYEVFRGLLKDFRLAKRLTQVEVARRLDLPQSFVSKYELGERRLDFVETAAVCEAIGVGFPQFSRAFSIKLAEDRARKTRRETWE